MSDEMSFDDGMMASEAESSLYGNDLESAESFGTPEMSMDPSADYMSEATMASDPTASSEDEPPPYGWLGTLPQNYTPKDPTGLPGVGHCYPDMPDDGQSIPTTGDPVQDGFNRWEAENLATEHWTKENDQQLANINVDEWRQTHPNSGYPPVNDPPIKSEGIGPVDWLLPGTIEEKVVHHAAEWFIDHLDDGGVRGKEE
jgi:hypothetical protein